MVGMLRTMYPHGDFPPELAETYADMLQPFALKTCSDAFGMLMHTWDSTLIPPWPTIEAALVEHTPALPPGAQHCAWCADTGWVNLTGTVTYLGIAYERGATACKWCDLGKKVFESAAKHRRGWRSVQLESDYTGTDTDAPSKDEKPVTLITYLRSPRAKQDPALQDPDIRARMVRLYKAYA